jgi:hypothetical protein
MVEVSPVLGTLLGAGRRLNSQLKLSVLGTRRLVHRPPRLDDYFVLGNKRADYMRLH